MDYCGERGLPHSAFLSWDELDRAKALAWQQRKRETHTCGVHPDVWDPDRGGDPQNLALESRLCQACEMTERGAEGFDSSRVAGEYQVWVSGPSAADSPAAAATPEER